MNASKSTVRPLVEKLAQQTRDGKMSRREFISTASTFGVSAAVAYGLIGAAQPTPAAAQGTPKSGGTLKIGLQVLDLKDPRTFDWPQTANIARQFLEPLVRWEPDFSFSGMLLDSWEVSDDAKTYTLNLRRDAVWNNGDRFDADDVIFNITRWCERDVEGNAMSAYMTSLIDNDTNMARDGAIERVDDFTVRLNLEQADITLIAGMSDYPALIVHRDYSAAVGLKDAPVGTGPFVLGEYNVGGTATVTRRADGWWGGDVFLDGVEFIDYGTDSSAIAAAFLADEIHVNDVTDSDFVELFDGLGLVRKEKETAQTMVTRMRADSPPFDNIEVRRAVQMAVDNSVVLELGLNGLGILGENHHVGVMHPEYAELPAPVYDPVAAKAMLDAAGHGETEMDLISIDGDWRTTSTDAIGAQLRDAGFNIKRTVIPGATFWNGWTDYPFSTTDWGARPLGVQVLGLAYRTGEPWNESGFSNAEFDAKLAQAVGIADPDARRELMVDIQALLQASGAIIQPFWRNMYLHHVAAVQGYERHQSREIHLEKVWIDA